jgi:hypothetical protein
MIAYSETKPPAVEVGALPFIHSIFVTTAAMRMHYALCGMESFTVQQGHVLPFWVLR